MPFSFRPLDKIKELIVIEPSSIQDHRGWFIEEYRRSEFQEQGITLDFPQENMSFSRDRGTIRGLHFQKSAAAQAKLVTCLTGEIFDVAVDIRKGSPTYAQWEAKSITAADHLIIWVPVGFAHGFQTLADNTTVMYKVSHEYSAAHERTVNWNDPRLGINWPVTKPVLSKKDSEAPMLSEVDNDFEWRSAV